MLRTSLALALRRHSAALLVALVLASLLTLAGCDRPAATPPDPQPAAAAGNEQASDGPPAAGGDTAAADPQPAANDSVAPAGEAAAPVTAAPSTTEPAATPTPDLVRGRVVLWHSYAGRDGDALAEILARLQIAFPELTVDTLFVAYDDLPQSYADAVRAGGGPDLVALPAWPLTEMMETGIVQPLDELLAPEAVAGYYPATLQSLERNGRLLGLPLTYELVSLYVNTSLVDGANLPTTTDELLAMAQAEPTAGTGIYANLYHLAWGLPAYGAALLDEEGTVVLDQSAGAADFLGWLRTLDETASSYVDLDYGMLLDRFKKGEFAFFVDGPWAGAELQEALGPALAVTPLPAGPAGPAQPWLSTEALLLNPNEAPDQQQRALLVAQALSDADAGTIWAATAGRLPAHSAAALGDDPLLGGFAAQAASALPFPHQPEMDEVWGYGGDMLIKVLNDVMTPSEAVVETAALINEANGR